MYCEICGTFFEGKKCPNTKNHSKIKKIASLMPDGNDALMDLESYKEEGYNLISEGTTDDEVYTGYLKLGFSYYIRFQNSQNWGSSITFNTYMAMLNHSSLYEEEKHKEVCSRLRDEFGSVFGLADGKTYVFEFGVERYIENSLFLAYYRFDTWHITEKKTGIVKEVDVKDIRKTATEDFVFGYAKCLFKK